MCRANEACYLMRVLIENSLPRLSQLLEEPWRARLQSMSLKDLICTKDGENTVAQLVSVLINEHQQSSGMLRSPLRSWLCWSSMSTSSPQVTLLPSWC